MTKLLLAPGSQLTPQRIPQRSPRLSPESSPQPTSRPLSVLTRQAAVIVNASKFTTSAAMAAFQAEVDRGCEALGWAAPLWLQTSAETRGADEARQAVQSGVDVVIVAGGDGTIRTVAQELAGTGIPLALLPIGTGNLLARNLGVPRKNLTAALQIACSGSTRQMDVGWLELDRTGSGTDVERFAFLVMAGSGFDAAIMAGADQTMKSRLGPAAYVLSGARATNKPMAGTTVSVDGVAHQKRRSHGVIVGNCGSLSMGLNLMPDADPQDGLLDGVALHQRGILNWMRVAWSVVTRDRRGHRFMPRFQGRVIEIRTDVPQPVEVDGDVVGEGRMVRFRVQAAGLLVRSPGADALL